MSAAANAGLLVLLLMLIAGTVTGAPAPGSSPSPAGDGTRIIVFDTTTGAGIPDAQVYFDGELAGRTSSPEGSFILSKQVFGKHSFRITKSGYKETTVKTNGDDEITVLLHPSAIHTLYGTRLPEQSLNIVFVPSNTSYDCTMKQVIPATQYSGSPDAFLADVQRLLSNRLFPLEKYSTTPAQLPADYRDRLSISYYWDGTTYADAFAGCAGTLPAGFYEDAPYTDVAVILYPEYKGSDSSGTCEPVGCANAPGPGPQVYFKVAANRGAIFLHESGHAMFGLMDTYCGQTYYQENQPSANIWGSNASCREDVQRYRWNATLCRSISAGSAPGVVRCEAGFYRYDPDPDLMSQTGLTAKFGETATRRIRYVLDTITGG